MTLLKGRDDLESVAGKASRAFRNATLGALQTAFLAANTGADKSAAAGALDHFYRAANNLRSSKAGFNKSTQRDNSARLTVMNHLATTEQFVAMRDFAGAKEDLLHISPVLGRMIVRLVAQGASARFSVASQQQKMPQP